MKEVLKLALEALQKSLPRLAPYGEQDWLDSRAAIKALEEALAKQEQSEPVAWMHRMDNTEGLKANGTGIVSITQKRKHPFGKAGVDFSKSYPVTSTPLYTKPQQRKPLTDDEIRKWWGTENGLEDCDMCKIDDFVKVVRAIEAAHGIKENT
jgi:hypothetical protein